MAYFLGFDAAKSKLDWALVNEQGVEQSYGKVVNEDTAIAELLLAVSGAYPGVSVTCVVESTSCYHYGLTETAFALGVPCVVCNPIITKQQVRATIRGKKTDRTDALMVARLGLRGEGRLYTPEPYRAAKHLARSVQKLSIFGAAFTSHEKHLTDDVTEVVLSTEAQALMQGVHACILTL